MQPAGGLLIALSEASGVRFPTAESTCRVLTHFAAKADTGIQGWARVNFLLAAFKPKAWPTISQDKHCPMKMSHTQSVGLSLCCERAAIRCTGNLVVGRLMIYQ